MLSKFIVSALLVLNAQALMARELVVVSDLDETLRMANVEKHTKAAMNLVKGVKPYEGLSLIFKEIKLKNPEAKFYYLSNSYPFLYNGNKWALALGLPTGEVLQRKISDKSGDFKTLKLREIARLNPDASWLLFGDNVERDPTFYREFKAENNLTDIEIYIRDARLIFPQETDLTFFQTEDQITDDLKMSPETVEKVKSMGFSKLVPDFLVSNLRERLINDCKSVAANCVEIANEQVKKVIDLISPVP